MIALLLVFETGHLRRVAQVGNVTRESLARVALVCSFVVLGGMVGPALSGEHDAADHACSYVPKGNDEVLHFDHCAAMDEFGLPRLKHEHFAALDFDRFDLASVNIDGRWYYVRGDGRLAHVMASDNGAEQFAEGLARSQVGKRIGFINRKLALTVPARYDGAFPFERGQATVCVGCRLASDGEHSWFAGGQWFCIDRRGRKLQSLETNQGARDSCAMRSKAR